MKKLRISDIEPGATMAEDPAAPLVRETSSPPPPPAFDERTEAVETLRQLRAQVDALRHRFLDDLETISTKLNEVSLRLQEGVHQSTVNLKAPPPAPRFQSNAVTGARPASANPGQTTISVAATAPVNHQGTPPAVEATKRLMRQLRDSAEALASQPVVPDTAARIDKQVAERFVVLAQSYIQAFVQMHSEFRAQAAANGNAATWTPDTLAAYAAFRIDRFLTDILDPLDLLARRGDAPSADPLIDYLAQIMGLERIAVMPGASVFDGERHTGADGHERPGATIATVNRSGYTLLATGEVLRKAEVRLQTETPPAKPADDTARLATPQDDSQPTRLKLQLRSAHGEAPPPPVAAPSAAPKAEPRHGRTGVFAADNLAELAGGQPGSLPTPPAVTRCQNTVFKLKIAVSNLLNAGKLPGDGGDIQIEIAALLRDYSNWVLQRWTATHTMCQAAAARKYASLNKTDPAHAAAKAWDPELVSQYERFRTTTIVEGFLDRLEAKIHAAGLDDHLALVDHFAREMELGRLEVTPRKSVYDPTRHHLTHEIDTSNPDALARAVVTAVVRPGYTDLETGEIARQAYVEVRLPKTVAPPAAQGTHENHAIDIDD